MKDLRVEKGREGRKVKCQPCDAAYLCDELSPPSLTTPHSLGHLCWDGSAAKWKWWGGGGQEVP